MGFLGLILFIIFNLLFFNFIKELIGCMLIYWINCFINFWFKFFVVVSCFSVWVGVILFLCVWLDVMVLYVFIMVVICENFEILLLINFFG